MEKEIKTLEKMKNEIEWSINYHSEHLEKFIKQREAIDLGINKILTSNL